VDEAQNMTRDMLLLIQHLFNFSTNTEFLIQMALFTQPDLQPKLNRLKSLKSRLSLAKLRPFTVRETREMMEFRWTAAGGKQFPFDEEALAEIFRITKGVPRSIVQLANEALIKVAVDKRKVVGKDTVLSASTELTFNAV
jgi:type II secretory pathway predicted ATPase ExeA